MTTGLAAVTSVEMAARLVEDLQQLCARRLQLEQDSARAVGVARAAGLEWKQIGAALGITAAAAQRRYGAYGRPGRL